MEPSWNLSMLKIRVIIASFQFLEITWQICTRRCGITKIFGSPDRTWWSHTISCMKWSRAALAACKDWVYKWLIQKIRLVSQLYQMIKVWHRSISTWRLEQLSPPLSASLSFAGYSNEERKRTKWSMITSSRTLATRMMPLTHTRCFSQTSRNETKHFHRL